MEEGFTFTIPSGIDLEKLGLDENISVIIAPGSNLANVRENVEYEQFLADVWVGIVLTLMVLVCICCMCSCLLYHKFQQWKRSVMAPRTSQSTVEDGNVEAELPSYSIASGLPSYEEALEQLKKVKELTTPGGTTAATTTTRGGKNKNNTQTDDWVPRTPPTPVHLSVPNLIRTYNKRCISNNLNFEDEVKPVT